MLSTTHNLHLGGLFHHGQWPAWFLIGENSSCRVDNFNNLGDAGNSPTCVGKTEQETNMDNPMAYGRGPRITTPREDANPDNSSLQKRKNNKKRQIVKDYQAVNQDKSKFEKIMGPVLGGAVLGVLGRGMLKKEKKGGSVKTKNRKK